MNYGLVINTAPVGEPVGVDEAKKQVELPQSDTNHDNHLKRLVKAARILVEDETNRALYTQTWDLYLDSFPCESYFYLPKAPLQSVSSIVYTDTAGASQTWSSSNYIVSTSREPGRVSLAYGIAWPSVRYIADTIRVRFVCGYGATKETVNEKARQMILVLVDDWFHNRALEGEMTPAAKRLMTNLCYGDDFTNYGTETFATT